MTPAAAISKTTTSYDFLSLGSSASLAFYQPPPHDVELQVSFENSCGISSKSEVFRFDCDDRLPKNLLAFPNPAGEVLYLEFQNLSLHVLHTKPTTVRIYDRLSRYLRSETVGSNSAAIDISSLENGLYFIHAVADGHRFSAKFVKQN